MNEKIVEPECSYSIRCRGLDKPEPCAICDLGPCRDDAAFMAYAVSEYYEEDAYCAHREIADLITAPHLREFSPGDRVRLSEIARASGVDQRALPGRIGQIVRDSGEYSISVRWDGAKKPSMYHRKFIELACTNESNTKYSPATDTTETRALPETP
jgi:hypothetical protein